MPETFVGPVNEQFDKPRTKKRTSRLQRLWEKVKKPLKRWFTWAWYG